MQNMGLNKDTENLVQKKPTINIVSLYYYSNSLKKILTSAVSMQYITKSFIHRPTFCNYLIESL